MRGNIFSKYYLSDFIKKVKEDLTNEINSIDITDSFDNQGLVIDLMEKFTITPLGLKDAEPSEPEEISIPKVNYRDERYNAKAYKIRVLIPFTGNRQLFDCKPSTSTIIFLDKTVTINNNNITADITLDELNSDSYTSRLSKIVNDISCNIPVVNKEIEPWNNSLEILILKLIQDRQSVVSKKNSFMQEIGLKINPNSDHYITPSPITRKKIPSTVTDTSIEQKRDLIPVLREEVYSDIKQVLYNVGQAMERKPSLYKGKHEEDLRDVFLLFLETRYESVTGVGEAFNQTGRTDILLKHSGDGSNIFVAECKVWSDKVKLLGAIDQLLSYLTHRDSKTSLMIFIKNKNSTNVIETVKQELPEHPNYKRFIKESYSTSLSYEFVLPTDDEKIVQIEVMFFHFPK